MPVYSSVGWASYFNETKTKNLFSNKFLGIRFLLILILYNRLRGESVSVRYIALTIPVLRLYVKRPVIYIYIIIAAVVVEDVLTVPEYCHSRLQSQLKLNTAL